MRIFARKTLREFWEKHPDSEKALMAWFEIFDKNDFEGPNEIKQVFKSADFVGDNKFVFNICGNKYRLIVKFRYRQQFAFIRFIGTHKEYDKVAIKEL